MGNVIGDIVPAAFGVSISPIPLVMLLILLFTERARVNSVAFLLGWLAGVTVLLVIAVFVGSTLDGGDSSPNGWANLVLGALFVLLAVNSFRTRPRRDRPDKKPVWMSKLDTIGPLAAFGLSAVLTGINAKNTPIIIASALTIGSAGLPPGQTVIAAVVFVLVASSTALVIVLAFLLFGEKVEPALQRLRSWLEHNNAYVMMFLFGFLGVSALSNALQAFT